MPEPGVRQIRVAVVDDDPGIVKVLTLILKSSGFTVGSSLGGVGAIPMIKELQPDVVLLDVMMPDMDGFEVCRRLKMDEETRVIPVIFITAKISDEDRKRGMDLGASDYLNKPFKPAVLLARIRELAADPGC